MGLAAVPYGTSQPWWKALFVCLIFAMTIIAVIEWLLTGSRVQGTAVVLPVMAMAALAFLQTISLPAKSSEVVLSIPLWNAISADPHQTRFFALQLVALGLWLLLLYRFGGTERRIRVLVHVIIAVAVISALFGIIRQTVQTQTGFGLPLLRPAAGYAQFINRNHFGFMMEMAFGLGLGLLLGGGVKRKHAMIYVALLLPIWTALVLSNSRGAILAMIVQLVVTGLLISTVNGRSREHDPILLRMTRSAGLRVTLLVVLVLGAALGAVWVGGDRLLSSVETIGRELNSNALPAEEGVTRNEIWRATLRMFMAHPILGVGLGGYWIAITAHHDASGTMTPQEAHNDYLELLASGGLIGFAIGVWFVVVVISAARKSLRDIGPEERFRRGAWFGAVVGMSGVAFHSLFDFGLHLMSNALLLAALLMIATNIREKKKIDLTQ